MTAPAWRFAARLACAMSMLFACATGPAQAEDERVRPQGQPNTVSALVDADFGVSTRQPGLRRRVQMYQWQRDGVGYRALWSERWIDSSGYDRAHANPPAPSIAGRSWMAERITLDGHPLDADTVRQLGRWQRFRPGFSRLSGRQSATFQPEGDGLGSAENPMAPAIGDLRIHWEELRLPPLADKLNLHQGRWVLIAGATAASDSPLAAAEPVAVVGFGWSWPRWGSWLLLLAAAAWLLWRRWRA